jgi:hypothetical protein
MAGDVWFQRDIQRDLVAAVESGHTMASIGASLEFQRGFAAAIRQMALRYGIAPETVLPPPPPERARLDPHGGR